MIRFLAAMFGVVWIASAAFAGLSLSSPADPVEGSQPGTGPKYALVIGVAAYKNLSTLANSGADAQLIAKTLIGLGFETQVLLDPGAAGLRDALSSHANRLQQASSALSVIYYAGHGAEVGGEGYLLAADAAIKNADDFKLQAVPLQDMVSETARANSDGVSMFFIDASRDDPFSTTDTRGLAVGSNAPQKAPDGKSASNVVIVYAAQAGQVSTDGRGPNSPFASALAEAMVQPGLDQAGLFRHVRNSVMESTQGGQIPAMSDMSAVAIALNPGSDAPALETSPETRAALALYERSPGEFAPTYEDGSYALLIGVSRYQSVEGRQAWRDLPSVSGDVTKLAGVLKDVHGFAVETVMDPTSDQLEVALESFINRHGAKPNARLLIYMAGHGTTTESYGRKTAWFVPTDAPALNPPAPFRNRALNLRRVEEWSETVEAKHLMWIFDSCFSGAAIRMIDTRSQDSDDGWSAHLHANPVRRVLTAGSENEEVPAESVFTARLIDVLSGKTPLSENGMLTGRQIGDFLREDIVRYVHKMGLKPVTPQSDTIVIPGEEGDIVFRFEPQLVAKWQASAPKP